ncbi:hypothetical protein [Streptomyces sp. NRRL F-5630]|uniref:hypothetical protein n=1 Tax=Streptomyces sp. NRRL F-5630 TaxID=1463864 RepID=UPI003EBBF29E
MRRMAGTVAASVLAAGAVLVGTHVGRGGEAVTAGVADAAPGYAAEDFAYPRADKILAEKGLVLKRGDGHITLADCASGTGQLEILARDKGDKICFDVIGDEGFLTMEIPAVFSVRGNDYSTTVDMTVGDEEKSFPITENTWTPVGESADPQNRDFLLVEIRTTK